MQINQPYDPRYNAKLYIPKLTEEERRARATPLENLLSLRTRLAATAAPEDVPVLAPAPDYIPTAQEVVFAEFPEFFAPQGKQPLAEVHTDEECLVSAGCIPLVPRLCLGTPSPELRAAAPPNKSGPQRRRSAPPGQRLRV